MLSLQDAQRLLDALHHPDWHDTEKGFAHANGVVIESQIESAAQQPLRHTVSMLYQTPMLAPHLASLATVAPKTAHPQLLAQEARYPLGQYASFPIDARDIGDFLNDHIGPQMWQRLRAVSHLIASWFDLDDGFWTASEPRQGHTPYTSVCLTPLLRPDSTLFQPTLKHFFDHHEWHQWDICAGFQRLSQLHFQRMSSHDALEQHATLAWAQEHLHAFGIVP